MTKWDPDGSGPEPQWLVIGGAFRALGDVAADRIVAWDGTQWHALGEGIPGDPFSTPHRLEVHALTVFEGDLIAAGSFLQSEGAAGNVIVRWDGSQWTGMGDEFDGTEIIRSLAVYEGELIAGGRFTLLGGLRADNLAIWDGTRWRPFSTGGARRIPHNLVSEVLAMSVFHGELFIGGFFNRVGGNPANFVARWNGQAWSRVEDGFDKVVRALVVYDGSLYAAGDFKHSGLQYRGRIARWDGTAWKNVGFGLDRTSVFGMAVTSRGLVVTGSVVTFPAHEHKQVIIWDGTEWSGTDSPFDGFIPPGAVIEYGDEIFVAGVVSGLVDGKPASLIAKWNGSVWRALAQGTDAPFSIIGIHGDELIVAGRFRTVDGVPAKQIAAWDGERWRALGDGIGEEGAHVSVQFRGDLIVGGEFLRIGSLAASGVARWDGQAWHTMGEGLPGIVGSLGVHKNTLYATVFSVTGIGTGRRFLAVWNGTRWREVQDITSHLRLLGDIEGTLYGTGSFILTGHERAVRIVRWRGSDWEFVGQPFPRETSWVGSIVSFGGTLVANGQFSQDPSVQEVGIVRWEEGEWKPLHSSTIASEARDLAIFNGDLYAAGDLEINGEVFDLVRWDGQRWHPVDVQFMGNESFRSRRFALQVLHNSLYVNGLFTRLGGEVSAYMARFDCGGCFADCDRSSGNGVLDIFDFLCFQSRFVAGEAYACDCDTTTGVGVCDVFDFLCFQAAFAQGCK